MINLSKTKLKNLQYHFLVFCEQVYSVGSTNGLKEQSSYYMKTPKGQMLLWERQRWGESWEWVDIFCRISWRILLLAYPSFYFSFLFYFFSSFAYRNVCDCFQFYELCFIIVFMFYAVWLFYFSNLGFLAKGSQQLASLFWENVEYCIFNLSIYLLLRFNSLSNI